jgi:autoinducer 2-degrading protein
MQVVCVHVRVKSAHRDDFVRATLENARNTVQEPGALRFDVIQSIDEPDRFMLYEVYRDEAGMNAHKETGHYALWRDTVGPWMAEPRQGVKYQSLFPPNELQWET